MRYCQGCRQLADFEADSMRVEAAVFNLMQIGELAKTSLSDDTKEQITAIPWRQIYGMRTPTTCAAWKRNRDTGTN